MNTVTQHNIAALVAVATSVQPQSASAGAINGGSIDRMAHNMALSCALHQAVGALSGTPTTTSVISKIQDSPDGSTWADYKPDGTNVATSAALTAADSENDTAVDLGAAQRYVRSVTTVAFTGGTSPAALVTADLVLGGQDSLPAA